ncbi:MAG: hypothetical protein IT370_32180 [Deltaproteobacteria bacterium]|nr:hypothetical protein [Deltaproteobacteria bacterium]
MSESWSLLALLARAATLAGPELGEARVVPLRFGLVLLPLVDDVVAAHAVDAQPPFIECEWLTAGVARWAEALSRRGPVAYVEAEYEAGDGMQAAVMWRDGRRNHGPERRERAPINAALRLLGVMRTEAEDETSIIRLARHPSTAAWLAPEAP